MTLRFTKSDMLAETKHGFFHRGGGVSTGLYDSLNCSRGSNDIPDQIEQNRHLVAKQMGRAGDKIVTLTQIHSATVVTVDNTRFSGPDPTADAMVTGRDDIILAVVTADCAPILFTDPKARIIGAAHAGWNGALNGIIAATIDAMEKIGADRNNITAVIGPCISQQNYEVGQEFAKTFMDTDPDFSRFFINGEADKFYFDLPMFCLAQLRSEQIFDCEWVNECTYANEKKYFSFRRTTHRDEPDYGRQISVITNSNS
ncbi:MAG: peptidoglycan editing factor PgeF [Rhodobacteraceae bacterium]|nr:peptidoglycan editing factor PgeF [Paracoccaceae bacterium]